MIQKIKVEGYQSLKSVELELGRFTVILGESNVGKSAMLRAVKALVENQTGLEDFLTIGMKVCRVELSMDSGNDDVLGVVWEKKKSGTQYHIHSTASQSLDKFGKGVGVPVEVINVLKMERIEFAPGTKFAPNFHDQFSTPFLLEETGGRVAKMLGEMSGVNLLYRANAEANVRAKRQMQKAAELTIALEKQKTQLAAYEFIRVKGPRLQEAKAFLVGVEQSASEVEKMARCFMEFARWQSASVLAHYTVDTLKPVLAASPSLTVAESIMQEIKRMKEVQLSWLKAAVSSKDNRKAIVKLSDLRSVSFVAIGDEADVVFMMRKTGDAWLNATHAVGVCQRFLKELQTKKERATSVLLALEKDLKVCPYCGHPLHKEGETCQ